MKITVNEAKKGFEKEYPNGSKLRLSVSGPSAFDGEVCVDITFENAAGQMAAVDIWDLLKKGRAPYSGIAQDVFKRLKKEASDPFYRVSADVGLLKPEYVADLLAKAPVASILKEADAAVAKEAARAAKEADRKKARQAKADADFVAKGKWEAVRSNYDNGNVDKVRFNATDDKSALRAIIDKWGWCGPISEPAEKICPSAAEKKELLASGELEEGDWYNSVKAALEFIEDGNGDGCDWIYYIRRPDGSYLFDSKVRPEEQD